MATVVTPNGYFEETGTEVFVTPEGYFEGTISTGGSPYSLTADKGSYTTTGITGSLTASRKVAATKGSYSTTGSTAGLAAGRKVAATKGSYSTTGTAATLTYVPAGTAYSLTVDTGSYTVTGAAAALAGARRISAITGSYSTTGAVAGLAAGRGITAVKGSYSTTGTAATLTYTPAAVAYTLTVDKGAVSLTGASATLLADRKVTAAKGTYTSTGTAATLTYTPVTAWTLVAEKGSYAVSGSAITVTGPPRLRTFGGRRQLRAGVRNADLDYNFAYLETTTSGGLTSQALGDHTDTAFAAVQEGDLIKKGSVGEETYTGGDGTTWAPFTGTSQTLTNGNLTAEDAGSTWPKVYSSTAPRTGSGKYAWEVTLDSDIGFNTANNNLVGFTTQKNTTFIGGDNTYSRVVTNNGKTFYNSIASGIDADREWYTVGATLMCLLDLDAGEFSIISSKHSVEKLCWSGLDTALDYWALLSQIGDNGGTGTIVTANFGATAFVNAMPAGYQRFDGTTATSTAATWINFTPTYIDGVVEDTTPELGGDLDAGAFDITNLTEVAFSGGESIIGTDVTNWDENLSTGIVAGGVLSVNGGDNTKFDVSAGSGIVVDHSTNPPTITPVAWSAFSAQTVTNLATSFATDIAINAAGAIVQQNFYTNEELRSLIFLGGLDHSNQTSVLNTFPVVRPTAGAASGIAELASALGELNLTGNAYNANVAGNLTIDKSAGTTYSYGRNFQANEDAPSTLANAAETVVSFGRVFNNGSGAGSFTAPGTTIDPDFYDDGSGTLAAVSTNKWTIQRILFFPNANNTFVQYGTAQYNRLIDALDAVPQAPFVELAGIRTASTRGYLLVKEGETDLTSSDTVFLNANKYGFVAGQDAGSAQAAWGNLTGTLADQTDLQNALDAKLDLAGGTMTGDLTMDATSNINLTAAAGVTDPLDWTLETSNLFGANVLNISTPGTPTTMSSGVFVNSYDSGTAHTVGISAGYLSLPRDPTSPTHAVNKAYVEGSVHVANGKVVCNGTTSPTVYYSNGCSISATAAGVITVTLDSALASVHDINVQVSGTRTAASTAVTTFTVYPTSTTVFTIRGFNLGGTLVTSPTVMFTVTDMSKF